MSPKQSDALLELIKQHIETDREQFAALGTTLDRVDANVQSLMETRASYRGMWKAITVISGAVATVIGLAPVVWAWMFRP